MYGDSRENLLEILAADTILSPITSVCGVFQESYHTNLVHKDSKKNVILESFICRTLII